MRYTPARQAWLRHHTRRIECWTLPGRQRTCRGSRCNHDSMGLDSHHSGQTHIGDASLYRAASGRYEAMRFRLSTHPRPPPRSYRATHCATRVCAHCISSTPYSKDGRLGTPFEPAAPLCTVRTVRPQRLRYKVPTAYSHRPEAAAGPPDDSDSSRCQARASALQDYTGYPDGAVGRASRPVSFVPARPGPSRPGSPCRGPPPCTRSIPDWSCVTLA